MIVTDADWEALALERVLYPYGRAGFDPAQHPVHLLAPPSDGDDHEAIEMVIRVMHRAATMPMISEGLRQRLAQVESGLGDEPPPR